MFSSFSWGYIFRFTWQRLVLIKKMEPACQLSGLEELWPSDILVTSSVEWRYFAGGCIEEISEGERKGKCMVKETVTERKYDEKDCWRSIKEGRKK
jgi:hypothetical protein